MVADHQGGRSQGGVSGSVRSGIGVILTLVGLCAGYYAYWNRQQSAAESQAKTFCEASAIGSDVSRAVERARELKLVGGGYSEQQGRFIAVFRGAIFNAFVCELTVANGKVTSRRVFRDGD